MRGLRRRGAGGAESTGGGRPRLTRRELAVAALTLGPSAAAMLAGCTGESEPETPETPDPTPVNELGVEVPAPSGEVSAVLDAAGDSVGVMLRDAEGEDFWADDFLYTRDALPSLLWQTDADVLWVIATDGSATRIAADDSGAWLMEEDAEVPEEISARL
ncbi:hypothetical protein [Brachybacterium aquaticum]|uniref:Uncharacterized protein n=1 Tax=Brachybacterium aquaticum TaxID=1432564 RepID=A0A841AFW7_9MICO|nr:hypothetical protein [Brachybacterium aquaticum]MBB5832827.1 hypothetical protein [Brachybacterium aquaticum]